ncbi:MAG: class A sortase [Atopostipes sp.]|nr:class A sortase [Atopostipes sp.]
MKKKNILSILSVFLIITGIFILFLPNISSKIIENRAQKNVENAENISANELQDNLDTESEFDFDSIMEIDPSKTLSSGEVDDSLILGQLLIPSIDLNLTVYNGVTNDILHAGVGTMKSELEMGKGNFPIAGHYASNEKTLFGNLTAVEEGHSVYLTDNDKIYEYEVYETKVVEPNEVHWIDDKRAEEHGGSIISLMNCYYVDGKYTDKRFFVFGELIDTHDFENYSIDL